MERNDECGCPTCGDYRENASINPEAYIIHPTCIEPLHGRDREMFELGWTRAMEKIGKEKKEITGR